jgi:hypothetical protein
MQDIAELRMSVVLPPLSAIAANPVKIIGTFFAIATLSAIFIPDELGWIDTLRMVTVVTCVTVVAATAGTVGARNRSPRRPKAPKRKVAKLKRVGLRPKAQLHVSQSRCQICRRPLTNPRSQMDGVGPDCRRRYGPRPLLIPNPARTEWEQRRHQALARREKEQATFDQLYNAALLDHDRLVRNWQLQLQTPLNRARAGAVRVSTQVLTIDAGVIISFILSEMVALGVDAAGFSLW